MNDTHKITRDYEAYIWGALFIWWGITELIPSMPDGTGAIGIGLILLGVNAARALNGVPTRGFSVTLGILALAWGGAELAGVVLSLPFEIPALAVVLIALGVIILIKEMNTVKNQ